MIYRLYTVLCCVVLHLMTVFGRLHCVCEGGVDVIMDAVGGDYLEAGKFTPSAVGTHSNYRYL